MNRLAAVTALTIACVLVAPALAADFDMAPTMMSPVAMSSHEVDWTGFNISIFGGAAINPATPGVLQFDQDLNGNFSEPLVAPLAAAFGTNFIGSNDGGFFGGIGMGYDMQMDKFVLGGVIDVARIDYAERQSAFSSTPATYTEMRELQYLGTLRARAGYLVTDNLLAYVHGGVAVGDTRYSFVSNNNNRTSSGGTDTAVGYQVGGGLETMLTESIGLGVEYAYTNLGESNFNTRFSNAPFVAVNPAGTDARGSDRTFDFHTIKGKLSYKF